MRQVYAQGPVIYLGGGGGAVANGGRVIKSYGAKKKRVPKI